MAQQKMIRAKMPDGSIQEFESVDAAKAAAVAMTSPVPSHERPAPGAPSLSDLSALFKQVVTGGPLVEGLARMPGPLGTVMQGANAARRELTNPENISSGAAIPGAIAGAKVGAMTSPVTGPAGPIVGGIIGAGTSAFLGSKYGEGKSTGEAMKEGAAEGLVESLGFGAGKALGAAKKPLQKLGRSLGYSALDPSPASLAQFHEAVRPDQRFIPEEATRLVKDMMFDMSEGAPGSLRYAKGLGSQLDDMGAANVQALERTGNSVGVGIDELVANLRQLRDKTNTAAGALDIPKALREVDSVEELIRNRPAGDWRPVTRGSLPMPRRRMETNAPFVVDSGAGDALGRGPQPMQGTSFGRTYTTDVGSDRFKWVPDNSTPVGERQVPAEQFRMESKPGPANTSRSGTFELPPEYPPDGGTFRAEALTLPETHKLKQLLDDALLTEYGKSAPAAIAGIRVPETANVEALKVARRAAKDLIEQRAAPATYRGADTTVAALNEAMHRTIPFERMAAEATGIERGGPGVRVAMGRSGPRISLFEYLSRRTAGYGARPAMSAGEFAGAQARNVSKLSPALARLAIALASTKGEQER